MPDVPRHVRIQQEKGKALARAVQASELQAAGSKREAALHEAEVQLERIARLLPNALQAGLTLSEIARVTGVSRPTLYELKARYTEGDISLAALQSVASRGPITLAELADHLGRSESEVAAAVKAHVDGERMDWEPITWVDSGQEEIAYSLTGRGLDTLEAWEFVEEEAEAEAGGA
jgi:transcriptional regulator with XRE-family HTH domain